MTGTEFVCQDVRGIAISCSEDQWKYLTKHKEMDGQQGVIKAIIESPDFINQSRDFKDRQTYYKQLVLPDIGTTYVRVVVEFHSKTGGERGYVINAFSCDGAQRGEKLLWKKK